MSHDPAQIYKDEPQYDAEGNSLYGHYYRHSYSYGAHILPRPAYVYPEVGDEIVALQDYQTAAISSFPTMGTLLKGDKGKVVGLRKPCPLNEVVGYTGLIVEFDRVRKAYPAGFVICWDLASDPKRFETRKPAPAANPQP